MKAVLWTLAPLVTVTAVAIGLVIRDWVRDIRHRRARLRAEAEAMLAAHRARKGRGQ